MNINSLLSSSASGLSGNLGGLGKAFPEGSEASFSDVLGDIYTNGRKHGIRR